MNELKRIRAEYRERGERTLTRAFAVRERDHERFVVLNNVASRYFFAGNCVQRLIDQVAH